MMQQNLVLVGVVFYDQYFFMYFSHLFLLFPKLDEFLLLFMYDNTKYLILLLLILFLFLALENNF